MNSRLRLRKTCIVSEFPYRLRIWLIPFRSTLIIIFMRFQRQNLPRSGFSFTETTPAAYPRVELVGLSTSGTQHQWPLRPPPRWIVNWSMVCIQRTTRPLKSVWRDLVGGQQLWQQNHICSRSHSLNTLSDARKESAQQCPRLSSSEKGLDIILLQKGNQPHCLIASYPLIGIIMARN